MSESDRRSPWRGIGSLGTLVLVMAALWANQLSLTVAIALQTFQWLFSGVLVVFAVYLIHDIDRSRTWIPDQQRKLQTHHQELIGKTFKPLSGLEVSFSSAPSQLEVTYWGESKSHELPDLPEYEYGIAHLRDKNYAYVRKPFFTLLDHVNEFNDSVRVAQDNTKLEETLGRTVPDIRRLTTQQALGSGQFIAGQMNTYIVERMWWGMEELANLPQDDVERLSQNPVDSVILRIADRFYLLRIGNLDIAWGSEVNIRRFMQSMLEALPRFREIPDKRTALDGSQTLVRAFKTELNRFLLEAETTGILRGKCVKEDLLKPSFGIYRIQPLARYVRRKLGALRRFATLQCLE